MEDVFRFGLLTVAAFAIAALYLAALRLVLGDGPAAVTPAAVGMLFILTLAGAFGAPLIYIAKDAAVSVVLSVTSPTLLVLGAFALLDTIVPKAFRTIQSAPVIFLVPILAAIIGIPFAIFLRLVH